MILGIKSAVNKDRRMGQEMKPETKFEQTCGALIAMLLTVLMLPLIGLWAAASGVERLARKIWNRT